MVFTWEHEYTQNLLKIVSSTDNTVHDAIVYAIKQEYDPNDKQAAIAATKAMLAKSDVDIEEADIDMGVLIPAIDMDGYNAYVNDGNKENEYIIQSIKQREKRENERKITYVPESLELYAALRDVMRISEYYRAGGGKTSTWGMIKDEIGSWFERPMAWVVAAIFVLAIIAEFCKVG